MNKSIWPFQINLEDKLGEAEEWCRNNLYHGGYYEPNWYRNGETFCFKDEKEAMLFSLRWQ
jgi:hypothetical protein